MTADEDVVLMVVVTVPDEAVGAQLADVLVRSRLAACVTRMPNAESTYLWEGTVERSSEFVLLIKTTSARWVALEETIRAHHPYVCPEVIALRVEAGSSRYLDWVRTCVKE